MFDSAIISDSYSSQGAATEIKHLRAREAEAIRLINAAFGEYACVASRYLSDKDKADFDKNFGEPARKFLRETSG